MPGEKILQKWGDLTCKKQFKIINNELDNILRDQKQPFKKPCIFQNFEKIMTEKLKKHNEFMASIDKKMNI